MSPGRPTRRTDRVRHQRRGRTRPLRYSARPFQVDRTLTGQPRVPRHGYDRVVPDDAARDRRSAEINEEARCAFLDGAAEEWSRTRGRAEEELRRILARYPGEPSRTSPAISVDERPMILAAVLCGGCGPWAAGLNEAPGSCLGLWPPRASAPQCVCSITGSRTAPA